MLVATVGSAQAVTVERMQVTRDDARYDVASVMVLDVPLAVAFRAASDYDRLPEFNPSILSSTRLRGHRLRSNVRLCVAFFCKTIRQVMRYQEHAPESIDMQVVTDAGDLKSGHAKWRFTAIDARRTRLAFAAAIEPAFWIPPLIGPYLIARELRRQTQITGRSIERLAADYAHDQGRNGGNIDDDSESDDE
ncbi:SRPBCC family protein [Salinisphaera aquimarina]|uniref:SRPBCC family protein n=1 Tax=Salinisphaera aquimarina TaxID=2094031 RepID=A0ABV7EWC5_9GAMM